MGSQHAPMGGHQPQRDLVRAKALIAHLLTLLARGSGEDSPEYIAAYAMVARLMPSAITEQHIKPREEYGWHKH